jgi:hypothetical protein
LVHLRTWTTPWKSKKRGWGGLMEFLDCFVPNVFPMVPHFVPYALHNVVLLDPLDGRILESQKFQCFFVMIQSKRPIVKKNSELRSHTKLINRDQIFSQYSEHHNKGCEPSPILQYSRDDYHIHWLSHGFT